VNVTVHTNISGRILYELLLLDPALVFGWHCLVDITAFTFSYDDVWL